MKIYLSHSGNYDYEAELYNPLKSSGVAAGHQIVFPHDPQNIDTNAKALMAGCELMLAEVSYPSTGQGIELGLASSTGLPILCIYRSGAKTSSSLRFVTSEFIEYRGQTDMLDKLAGWLAAGGDAHYLGTPSQAG